MMVTGVDSEPNGQFDNDVKDKDLEEKIQAERLQISELTPKLQAIVEMIDIEIKAATDISSFLEATIQPEVDVRSELKAKANYKKYLEMLKTKFALALEETKR